MNAQSAEQKKRTSKKHPEQSKAIFATPLALEGISILVVSTYQTADLMVKESHLEEAIMILSQNGHQVE